MYYISNLLRVLGIKAPPAASAFPASIPSAPTVYNQQHRSGAATCDPAESFAVAAATGTAKKRQRIIVLAGQRDD